jgi:glycosyltransferase involved in cell wall biosynthesis
MSVLNQSHQRFELIVVNDGGVDVSHVIHELADTRVSYLRSERHVGIASARNLGLAKARGEFVAYLNDECIYYPIHLETLLASLANTSCGVAYSNCRLVTGAQGSRIMSLDYDKDRLLVVNDIPIISVMHKRCLLETSGAFDEHMRFHEDWDLLIRLAQITFFYHGNRTTYEMRTRSCFADRRVRFEATREIYRKHQPTHARQSVTRARRLMLLIETIGSARMKALLPFCRRVIGANRWLGGFIIDHVIPLHLRAFFTSYPEVLE